MNAAQIHLVSAHVPVVGSVFALALLAVGVGSRSVVLLRTGYAFLFVCALTSTVAYYSGPPALETLEAATSRDDLVGDVAGLTENHALIGRVVFTVLVVLGVVALSVLLRAAQGEPSPRWLDIVVLAATIGAVYLAAWAAHIGGQIRHPEIGDGLPIFPAF